MAMYIIISRDATKNKKADGSSVVGTAASVHELLQILKKKLFQL